MTSPRRRGPAPRFSREQLVDAAVAVVEEQGFAALSLRSVARHLAVGPMTLYTYVDGSDELAGLVVDRVVADAVEGIRWKKDSRALLKQFARLLDALVLAHPAIVDAYGRGLMSGGRAREVAATVQTRLVAGGMTPERAAEAYIGVHSLVLGYAFVRAAGRAAVPPDRLVDRLLDGFDL